MCNQTGRVKGEGLAVSPAGLCDLLGQPSSILFDAAEAAWRYLRAARAEARLP